MIPLVEIHGLRVLRDRRLILDIAHLVIEKSRVVALVGPNGAGKSTLLLVLAGLIRPQQGSITYNGARVDCCSDRDYRRRIGLVMQEPLLLDMSVYDNIAVGLRFRNIAKSEVVRRVDEWLERLNIGHLKKRPAHKLSGGEAQRVALARSLVLQPELFLLDEPFSSLDQKSRTELIRDLKALLPASHATTLFTSHDDREVDLLAEGKIELRDGKCCSVTGAHTDGTDDPGL